MLEKILKLYTMYMATGVTSPMPHLIGPPGCGKSTVVKQAAGMLNVKLHTINVSRISPLEIEGVQMPVDMETESRRLMLLLNEMWASLKTGDIVLWDEYLRGFPEVYNALLDINTSRHVRGHDLPKVFMIAASNTATAYDPALEDRLMHLPVPDPRKSKTAKNNLAFLLVDELGLYPKVASSMEMEQLLDSTVLPMFNVLDSFKRGGGAPALSEGKSIRNLVGQALLRESQVPALTELIDVNNRLAIADGKPQFVLLLGGKINATIETYIKDMKGIADDKLSPLQLLNKQLNFQLIESEKIRNHKEGDDADEDDILSAY